MQVTSPKNHPGPLFQKLLPNFLLLLMMRKKKDIIESFGRREGQGIDIVFSFDTTGSMYPCLQTVQSKIIEVTSTIFRQVRDVGADVRVAIIAHGDYNDPKVIQRLEFSTSAADIKTFIDDITPTKGGYAPEAYELALQVAARLPWDATHAKALVLIGDEVPNSTNHTEEKISWRAEVEHLLKSGVFIYGVQAGDSSHASPFYKEISEVISEATKGPKGRHLHLDNIDLLPQMFLATTADGKPAPGAIEKQADNPDPQKEFHLKEPWWNEDNDLCTVPEYKKEGDRWVRVKKL